MKINKKDAFSVVFALNASNRIIKAYFNKLVFYNKKMNKVYDYNRCETKRIKKE